MERRDITSLYLHGGWTSCVWGIVELVLAALIKMFLVSFLDTYDNEYMILIIKV
jgi:hypothetical protein